MDIHDTCITIIVTILGIAYPILYQVISRLDDKYSSIVVIKLFDKERVSKYFKPTLIVSLVSIVIWYLKLSPSEWMISHFKNLNWLIWGINHSASIFLIITTIFLVINFLYLVELIRIYLTPGKFSTYLGEKHRARTENDNMDYFQIISDVLYSAIRNQNVSLVHFIRDFLHNEFRKIRKEIDHQPVRYPLEYYFTVNQTIQELCINDKKKFISLEDSTIGAILLYGASQESIISEQTLTWQWNNLLLPIEFDRLDMIMSYWVNAFDFAIYHLPRPSLTLSISDSPVEEQEKRVNVDEYRFAYIEFHYAFGGLLLFREKYKLLNQMLNYSTGNFRLSGELFYESINDIFNLFIRLKDPKRLQNAWINSRYPFPNIHGYNSNTIIKSYIYKFIALQFLRKYSDLGNPQKKINLIGFVNLERNEKEYLMEFIDDFIAEVDKVMADETLIRELGLLQSVTDWKDDNNPVNDLYKLKNDFKYQITRDLKNIKITPDLENGFRQEFRDRINDILLKYTSIRNSEQITENYKSWYIHRAFQLIPKNRFYEMTIGSYSNYYSYYIELFTDKIQRGISETLFYAKKDKLLLKSDDVLKAVKKLTIDKNDLIIVDFLYKEQYPNHIQQENIDLGSTGIEIISFDKFNDKRVGGSIFLVRKSDLPSIQLGDPDKKLIEKFNLQPLQDPNGNLFASILDLNQTENEPLIEEYQSSHPDKDLEKHALLCMMLKLEVRWKKEAQSIMIEIFSPYDEKGILNSLNDVKKSFFENKNQ